jgi:sulfonate transport system permease protein
MTNRTGVAVSGLLVPLAAIATWQVLESAGLLTYEYLPSPTEVLAAVVELTRTGELAGDLAYTLGVALVATAITLPLGGALGLAIGLVPGVRRYLLASIDFLRTIPAVALVPVAVLTFGPAPRTELMLAVYAGMWPIVLNTAGGVAGIHPRQYDVARTLQLSPAARLRKIVVPAVIPAWLVGARLSAVVALVVAIVTEMMVSPRGLGGGLVQSLNALAPARMWAYALVCGVVGMVLNAGLRRAVRLAVPTAPRTVTSSPARSTSPDRGGCSPSPRCWRCGS